MAPVDCSNYEEGIEFLSSDLSAGGFMDAVLAKKLQYKQGMKALVLNSPPGYLDLLTGAIANATGSVDDSLEFVQVFVKNLQELGIVFPAVEQALKNDGLLWITYPKGTSKVKTDLNRDILWKEMEKYHLLGVSLVSIDKMWSAMRFRPAEKVGKSKEPAV
jgi:hypothetical protein